MKKKGINEAAASNAIADALVKSRGRLVMVHVRKDGVITFSTPGFSGLTAGGVDDIAGRSIYDYIPEKNHAAVREALSAPAGKKSPSGDTPVSWSIKIGSERIQGLAWPSRKGAGGKEGSLAVFFGGEDHREREVSMPLWNRGKPGKRK